MTKAQQLLLIVLLAFSVSVNFGFLAGVLTRHTGTTLVAATLAGGGTTVTVMLLFCAVYTAVRA